MANITMDNLPKFKKLYKEAVTAGEVSFMFEGQEVLVSYAKYVLEYVETVLPKTSGTVVKH